MIRVVACVIVWTGLSLGLTGCSLFKKNAKGPDRAPLPPPPPAARNGGKEPARFPGSDPIKESVAGADSADVGGLLAGTVFDAYNGHPKDVFVRYIDLDDNKQEETPIDVAVSSEGHFTIHGVKPNHHYKLIARAKDGSRMLAGVTYTKAPNIRVHILIREENANGAIPPVPGAPVYTPKSQESGVRSQESGGKGQESGVKSQEPGNKSDGSEKAEEKKTSQRGTGPDWGPVTPANVSVGGNIPELPTRPIQVSNPPRDQGWQPGVVNNNPPAWPPLMDTTPRKNVAIPSIRIETPRPIAAAAPAVVAPVPAARGDGSWGPGPLSPAVPTRPAVVPARVPSCVLVGKKLVNLALNDVNHKPWEFKSDRKGKLVLFDFWGTMCVPCKQAIPHLRILQSQYGGAGLEVVGIAYEAGGSFEEQAGRVNAVAQRLQINYRLLLGGGSQCPVQASFNIRAIPTMVLVDENGWIVWRNEGLPNRSQLEELELIIKRRLGL